MRLVPLQGAPGIADLCQCPFLLPVMFVFAAFWTLAELPFLHTLPPARP